MTSFDEAASALVEAVQEFTGAAAVVMTVAAPLSEDEDPASASRTSAGGGLAGEDLRQLAALAALPGEASDDDRPLLIDHAAREPRHRLVAERGFRGVLGVHLDTGRPDRAALFVIDREARTLSPDDRIALGLAAGIGAAIATSYVTDREADERRADAFRRLSQHVAEASTVQDVTGNGAAVALGWLDALASGRLDEDERARAVSSVARRLRQTQAAVNQLIESTARSIIEQERMEPVDVSIAWRDAHSYGASPRGTGSPVVLARTASLTMFLRRAGAVLVPELLLDAESVRIPITDVSRLDLEARTLLWASGGSLEQDLKGTFASWDVAHPWT